MHDKGKVKWTIQFSFKRSKSEETHFKINDRTYHVYLFLGALWSVWFDVWKGAPRQMPEDDVGSSYSKNFLICTHHSLVLWRRPPWLLSWSSRLLNQGVRYFPSLFECWVFEWLFFSTSAEIQNPWSVTCFAKSQTGTNDVTELLPLSSTAQWRKTCRLQWFFVSGCFLAFCSFISPQVSFSSTKLYDMAKCRYLRLQFIGK